MKSRIYITLISLVILLMIAVSINSKVLNTPRMIDFSLYNMNEMQQKAKELGITISFEYRIDDSLESNTFISQSIKVGSEYKEGTKVLIMLSKKEEKKKLTAEDYKNNKVNEMGLIPIMMYHGIINMKSDATAYTGGNVDKDGYNRTTEAFINDLELYYQKGYRMIRLIDYINGEINVELGKSPIVLTFDDGNKNNINVIGLDENNNIIIDENSAVGILESFKKKYPDFNVTATFFLNEQLFNQGEYNELILKWLVKNGYDIGNHTLGHVDFLRINTEQTQNSVGYMYQRLNEIIPQMYVPIVALPYGSPGTTAHPNFNCITKGKYNDFEYETKGTLRVGWEPYLSPFHKNFNALFMKRIRAYDNDGKDFDIQYTFNMLETRKYISDGDKDTIVITDDSALKEGINKKITKY